MIVHCVNCGQPGHIIKTCKEPITSFGILLYKIIYNKDEEINDKNEYLTNLTNEDSNVYPKIKFLLVQRRNTMGFVDFLRGKYSNHDKMYTLINETTKEEKEKLKNCNFTDLWDFLWINKSSKIYKTEYSFAKKKFEDLNILNIINNSKDVYNFTEFSIPKGRKNINETNLKCAERELYEETGYSQKNFIYIDKQPIIEDFVGTDNIRYKHIYFMAKLKDEYKTFLPSTSYTQNMEIKNKGWFTYTEAEHLFRPYEYHKNNILKNFYDFLINALKQKKFNIFKN